MAPAQREILARILVAHDTNPSDAQLVTSETATEGIAADTAPAALELADDVTLAKSARDVMDTRRGGGEVPHLSRCRPRGSASRTRC